MSYQAERGFTAVELMVTLFIAALMVLSGQQLFNLITQRVGEARELSEASAVGYEALRKNGKYKNISTSYRCPTSTSEAIAVPASAALPAPATMTLSRCKPSISGGVSGVQQVKVVVKYGSPQKEVVHATFVSSS